MRFLLACLAIIVLASVPCHADGLEVSYDGESVTVGGVTPFGTIALFSVGKTMEGWARNTRFIAEQIVDADGDGVVTYTPDSGFIPRRSVWAIVDVETGNRITSSPPGFRLARAELPAQLLIPGTGGESDSVDLPGRSLLVIVERRSQGFWAQRVSDGGVLDADGDHDGSVRVPLDALFPLEGSPPPPTSFQRWDLVVAIDTDAMALWWHLVR